MPEEKLWCQGEGREFPISEFTFHKGAFVHHGHYADTGLPCNGGSGPEPDFAPDDVDAAQPQSPDEG